jgi:CheY-like chemotaxis protein
VCEYVGDALVLERPAAAGLDAMPASLRGKTVLVVDDDPDTLVYLTALLEDHGLRTVTARNAAEGLQAARDARPDAITLDISMPGRSGIDVFTRLRSARELASIPVVIVTGAIEFRQLVYHRNVPPPDGYVEKPVKPELLLMSVRKVLELRHRAAAPAPAQGGGDGAA